MSFDQSLNRREAILEQLLVLGSGMSGIAYAARNQMPLPTNFPFQGVPRPAFIVYDGSAQLAQNVMPHKIAKMPSTIWCMKPQVVVLLERRDLFDNMTVEAVVNPVGPDISNWAELVKNTITNDPVIVDLVTPQGTHYLRALDTDLKVGGHVGAYGAWLMMHYEFFYPVFTALT